MNEQRREVPEEYDPQTYRTPTDQEVTPESHHRHHHRHYDVGLVAPPLAIVHAGRWIALVMAIACLAFLGVIITLGATDKQACLEREALANTLIEIVERGQIRLKEYNEAGTLSDAQYAKALKDNKAAIEDLTVAC